MHKPLARMAGHAKLPRVTLVRRMILNGFCQAAISVMAGARDADPGADGGIDTVCGRGVVLGEGGLGAMGARARFSAAICSASQARCWRRSAIGASCFSASDRPFSSPGPAVA